MNIQPKVSERTTLTLPEKYFENILIASKDTQKGISPQFLEKIWESINENLVEAEHKNLWAFIHQKDYYPGINDLNEVRAIEVDLDLHREFELIKSGSKVSGDRYYTLIQHKALEGEGTTISQEIKASDDLAEVYVLPVQEALNKMKSGSSGRAKVQAAYEAVSSNCFLKEEIVSFGWGSKLQRYDDVILTTQTTTGSRPIGTITGYVKPNESIEKATKRELEEETGLEIPLKITSHLVGNTFKKDWVVFREAVKRFECALKLQGEDCQIVAYHLQDRPTEDPIIIISRY